MKVLVAASFIGASLALATMSGGIARADDFHFSFDTGGVRFAFQDGYWDRDHHWHAWRNKREREEFHHRFADRYDTSMHTKVRNQGWRDDDHDGVPNARDRHPENPHRN